MRISRGRKYIYPLLSAVLFASFAFAATQIYIEPSITLNEGFSAHKPKIQRMGDGRLVTVYGDNTVAAGDVYDLKGQNERAARDI